VVILEVKLSHAHEVPEGLRRTHVVAAGVVGMVNIAVEGTRGSTDLAGMGVADDPEALLDTAPTSSPRQAVAEQAVVVKGHGDGHYLRVSDE
jgi:hypothetical protein